MKRTFVALIATGLLISGCGSNSNEAGNSESNVNQNQLPEEVSKWTNPKYEIIGKQACLDALKNEVSKTTMNAETIDNDKSATFKMSLNQANLGEGSMSWYATIETSAGIPWEHFVQCHADLNTEPPTIRLLKAEPTADLD